MSPRARRRADAARRRRARGARARPRSSRRRATSVVVSPVVDGMKVEPAGALVGHIAVPGDKSISHRAVLIGAIARRARRTCTASAAPPTPSRRSRRCAHSASRSTSPPTTSSSSTASDFAGCAQPDEPVDCGNAGTLMRLLAGILAGQHGRFELTGDESLRARPMDRDRGAARADGRALRDDGWALPPSSSKARTRCGRSTTRCRWRAPR